MKRIGNINGKILILGTSNRTTSKYVEITPKFLKTISTIGEWSIETPTDITKAEGVKESIEEIKEEITETSKKSKKKALTEEELGL